ncbi:MAG: hypothetical protein FJ104_10680, partial [Deltaproteobacteria bacterium]|nr:hypothetical protein [Deltaproteobacteria bacterium]
MATLPRQSRDPSDRVAKRLVAEGRVNRELHEAAARHRKAKGIRYEEALIEAGVQEEQLLRWLAESYRTQFITLAKLAAAQIDKRTLALVPAQFAEARHVVP